VPRPQGPASCSTDKSFEIIRSLIDEIRLVPEDGALKIELRGELAGILALASESTKARGLSTTGLAEQIKMVADTQPPTVHNLPGRLDAATPASLPTDGLQSYPTRDYAQACVCDQSSTSIILDEGARHPVICGVRKVDTASFGYCQSKFG
jgi:hypothetical protein